MLRFLFPVVSLLVAGLSIGVELSPREAGSRVCLYGGCRYDQTFYTRATPENAAALLNEAPADPTIWCTYGEFFSAHGQADKAQAAFDRALILGSGVSSVLMRVANFDFTHERTKEGLRLAGQILTQTNGFDGILFSYMGISGEPVSRLLGTAIPATPRAAASWMGWVRSRGSERDILDTWAWMRKNGLADEQSAADTAASLWQRKAYRDAQELWADWLGERRGDYLHPQLLTNTRSQESLSGSPFDWSLTPNKSVEFSRDDGLEVRFLGQENISAAGAQRFTAIRPGRYRFSAEVSADNLTTDEGVFFQITDAENAARLSVETPALLGKRSRSWIHADFVVPGGMQAVQIKLARRPSLKFDDKIAGTLHIYRVSLVPSPQS